ncbi:hypothetical protein [Rhodovulum marinum]|uniref:hypothetical protein n=1 Tax=Rhodovulum marinum TaxID=320662 RepID=UPI001053FA2A|nr:hypothetical protein [Rhodovulum marinum]
MIALLALAGCQESVDERAEAAGCPDLERQVGMIFVRAGVSDAIQSEWQRDMQRYGMKRTPLAYPNAGLNRHSGEASSSAVKAVFGLVGSAVYGSQFDPSEWATAEEFGDAIATGLSSVPEDYPGRERTQDYFQRCSLYVGEYLSSADRFLWATDLYRNPDQGG